MTAKPALQALEVHTVLHTANNEHNNVTLVAQHHLSAQGTNRNLV